MLLQIFTLATRKQCFEGLADFFSFIVYALLLFLFVFQVVANAVAALSEIGDVSPTAAAMMEINSQTINKLLTALNECTE